MLESLNFLYNDETLCVNEIIIGNMIFMQVKISIENVAIQFIIKF